MKPVSYRHGFDGEQRNDGRGDEEHRGHTRRLPAGEQEKREEVTSEMASSKTSGLSTKIWETNTAKAQAAAITAIKATACLTLKGSRPDKS